LNNILVVGASSGIGRTIAELLERNHNVIKVARRECEGNFEKFDVSNLDGIDDLVKSIVKKYGKLDALIYSAGIQNIKPLRVIKTTEIREIFDINFFAPMLFAKSFSSKRVSNKEANILFISSIAGIKPENGILAYSASKAALNNFTQGLAKEIAPIRVNAIAPGFLDTEMTRKFSNIYNDEFKQKLKNENPLGIGNIEDVANLAEFLISSKAKYITGEIIRVDGGALL